MFTVPQATERGQVRTPNCLFMNTVQLEVPKGWHRQWYISCCLLCRIWFTTHINIDAIEEETNVWYNRSINCLKFWEAFLRNTTILRTGRVRCFWFNPLKWKLQTGRHAKLVLIHYSAFIRVFCIRFVCMLQFNWFTIIRYPTSAGSNVILLMLTGKTQWNWPTRIKDLCSITSKPFKRSAQVIFRYAQIQSSSCWPSW